MADTNTHQKSARAAKAAAAETASKTEAAAKTVTAAAKRTSETAADAFKMSATEMPEAFRSLTERGLDQTRDAYARLKTVSEEATGVMEETLDTTREGMLSIQRKSLDAAKENFDATFDFANRLLGVKSVADAVELQTSFVRERFQAFVDYSKDVQSTASQLAADSAAPVRAAFSKTVDAQAA